MTGSPSKRNSLTNRVTNSVNNSRNSVNNRVANNNVANNANNRVANSNVGNRVNNRVTNTTNRATNVTNRATNATNRVTNSASNRAAHNNVGSRISANRQSATNRVSSGPNRSPQSIRVPKETNDRLNNKRNAALKHKHAAASRAGKIKKKLTWKDKCKEWFKKICCCGICIEKWKSRKKAKNSGRRRSSGYGRSKAKRRQMIRNPSERIDVVTSNYSDYEAKVYYCNVTSNFEPKYPKHAPIANSSEIETLMKVGKPQPSLQCIYLHEDRQRSMDSDYHKVFGTVNTTRTFGGQCHVAPIKQIPATSTTKNHTKPTFLSNCFSCLKKNQTKGANQTNRHGPVQIPCPVIRSTASIPATPPNVHVINPFNRNQFDFGCQISLKSNHSLEIVSHVLNKSVSQISSVETVNSTKVKNQLRRRKKPPSALQIMMYTINRRFKDKRAKDPVRNKKKNVVVLRLRKAFSNTSTKNTISTARKSSRFEKPLIIRDNSSFHQVSRIRLVGSQAKIWGPGEVLLKKI